MMWIKRLFAAESGSILVMGALSMVSVIGMSGLAVELGNAYTLKVNHQRVADMAALAAALSYKTNSSETVLTPTAQDVAQVNGLGRSTTSAELSADKSKVTVTIVSSMPIALSRVISTQLSIPVKNVAVASLATTNSAGCVMALSSSPTYGVTLSGGVSLSAAGCSVVTNSGVTVPAGTHIYASQVTAGKTISDPAAGWDPNNAGIVTAPTAANTKANKGITVSDPLATDSGLAAAFARLGQGAAPITPIASPDSPTLPTQPTVPVGTDWTLDYSGASPPSGVTKNGNNWFAASGGTYNIKALNIAGGMTLTFQGASTVTISNGITSPGQGLVFGNCTCKINGNVNNNSQTMTFGDGNLQFGGPVTLNNNASIGNGDVSVAGTLTTSSAVSIGNGTHKFGTLVNSSGTLTIGTGDLAVTNTFTVAGNVTIGAGTHAFGGFNFSSGTVTMGAGDFSVAGPLQIASGMLTVGNGSTWIGKSASGVGMVFGGGAKLYLGNGNLTVAGSIELSSNILQVGAGNVLIGRSNAGVGFSTGSGVTVTTGGGTYFSVIGPMNISQGTVTLGPADYRIGNSGTGSCATTPNANCVAIAFGNGNLTFSDGPFSANGNITVSSNGSGNVLQFGATAFHYINGSIMDQGPIRFGAGQYLINGQLSNTNNGAMTGTNVTLILKDQITLAGSAGFNITAPTTGTDVIPNVAIATKTTTAIAISAGSNNILTGAFYAPNSDVTLSGGASVGSNNQCLTYIVNTLTLNGGSTAATSCNGLGSGSSTSGKIALIQ